MKREEELVAGGAERSRKGEEERERHEQLLEADSGSEEAEMSIASEVPRWGKVPRKRRTTKLRQYERMADGIGFARTDGTGWSSNSAEVV